MPFLCESAIKSQPNNQPLTYRLFIIHYLHSEETCDGEIRVKFVNGSD